MVALLDNGVVLVGEFEAVLPAEAGKERGQVVDPSRVDHAIDQGCPVVGLIDLDAAPSGFGFDGCGSSGRRSRAAAGSSSRSEEEKRDVFLDAEA
ncbi:hypothetical protein OHS59_01670 [Streptomyces sp. NBC_00414]|uniref:hypothetical protein n=1 Tax=Streptomyces sp. NBC_00414 TaxID=2975739 RepID=UPI002E22A198